MKVLIVLCLTVGVLSTFISGKPVDQESSSHGHQAEAIDLLRRLTRQASNPNAANPSNPSNGKLPCKYRKGSWSSCDPQTKVRTRTLTLKKGDASCEATKTLHKECKGGKKGNKQRNSSKNRPSKNNRARNSSSSTTN